VSEFSCPNPTGTQRLQHDFMRASLRVLDADVSVERYAWFAPNLTDFPWIGAPAAGTLEGHSEGAALGLGARDGCQAY
jgi:hypothetical protein